MYALMDTDGSGEIDSDELNVGMREVLGMSQSRIEVEHLFREIDEDLSNSMSLVEFSHMMTKPSSSRQLELKQRIVQLREAFLLFDLDRSGEVDLTELHDWMVAYGEPVSIGQVQAIVAAAGADKDGDGNLDFTEFFMVLSQGHSSQLGQRLGSQLAMFKSMFHFIDPSNSGRVTMANLSQLFRSPSPSPGPGPNPSPGPDPKNLRSTLPPSTIFTCFILYKASFENRLL